MSETHLINRAGEKTSVCGVRDPLPVMCAFAVPLHRANYDLKVCDGCEGLTPENPWAPSWAGGADMRRPVAVLEPEARYGTCESCHRVDHLVVVAYDDTRFEVCRPCACEVGP